MRVAIREQLAALVIFAVLTCLVVVSVPTWNFVYNFVVGVETSSLALTASLKATRISSEINLLLIICQSVASRILLQDAFGDFYNGNATSNPFDSARRDITSAMTNSQVSGLLQARLYSRNITGAADKGLLNVTAAGIGNQRNNIALPYLTPDGRRANLSDTQWGYPPSLYPNITYQATGSPVPGLPDTQAWAADAFPNVRISDKGGLVLGPLIVNETYALISLTIPVRANYNSRYFLGYMTLVVSATSLLEVQTSREGLDKSGMVLIVGPAHPSNKFAGSTTPNNGTRAPERNALGNVNAHFVLPPITPRGQADRHGNRDYHSGNSNSDFELEQYQSVLNVYYNNGTQLNNATADLSTTNEQGVSVAVGIARPQSDLVNWAVVVEKARSEAYQPISKLRTILLACAFGTAALILLLVIPCAHFGVRPIRRLKEATEKSIRPPGYEDELEDLSDGDGPSSGATRTTSSSKSRFFAPLRRRFRKNRKPLTAAEIDAHRRVFRIPGRVVQGRHLITDELTELTKTYNSMSDELLKQYTLLDEKVAERTRQLEISKKAAEAANESKTLFIANISHELKTPLNGIMGICAVCMEDDDLNRIRSSLRTVYKSGDLLLHLLEDLLSFSKNQISHQVSLERREFRLGDIKAQIESIFDKQVRENNIRLSVEYLSFDSLHGTPEAQQPRLDERLPALGPPGMGRLKDAYLMGDHHRILQVIINLVGNSVKFTPVGGKVTLRIRCLGEVEQTSGDELSRNSSLSRPPSVAQGWRTRTRGNSSSIHSSHSVAATAVKDGTALEINPMDPKLTPRVSLRERSASPPPIKYKSFVFEFEVEDSGHGVPEHMQTKIFEPFVQGDSGLNKKFGGTGLGLSICAQLVKLMGGSIGVKSAPKQGSVFTMRIPLEYVKDRTPSTASSSIRSRANSVGSAMDETQCTSLTSTAVSNGTAGIAGVHDQKHSNSSGGSNTAGTNANHRLLENKPRLVGLSLPFFTTNESPHAADVEKGYNGRRAPLGTSGSRLKVLVADDNATNIEVVSRMLKLEDVYDVTVAKDGQEAYELVKESMMAAAAGSGSSPTPPQRQFDVIFMDVQMPNVNGLESTRLIRKMGYVAPIVALTAFSEESNVQECMASGMNEFLSKPIRRPALKKVLTKISTIEEEDITPPPSQTLQVSPPPTPPTTGGDELEAPREEKTTTNGAV
ncbi:sensor histidine kinase/response regulator TcsB/Sln1, putative [Cordyceps militaris CM01]|uniref:histidine kinase n=1 Tax=Cordyceps militaris (strain CM01) TaxID=983644 RepID=G3JSH8_CORMM|nr:sensor histidine kinase/response regulator TcsB/Sln1, putative [Cordyceps militaris CM01]EGX88770.1 sensor histidine kinase/response regulator TcsB/Sln1, putative [Cordyceps militaris CM01]